MNNVTYYFNMGETPRIIRLLMRWLQIAGVTALSRGYLPLEDAGRKRCGGGMAISSNSVTGLPTT